MTNNYSGELSKYIKQWIIYDDFIKECNSKCKAAKEEKDILEEKITNSMKKNSLTHTKFKVGNNHIIYHESNSTCSLSYKFIHEALGKYLKEKQVNKICEILKIERESNKKISYSLKRTTDE